MRLRSAVTAVVTAVAITAGLVVTTPGAAQADVVRRISCRNNNLHYTDSDLRLSPNLRYLGNASWHTHASFHPDRITWSAYTTTSSGDLGWVLVLHVGGSSSTLDDVETQGQAVGVNEMPHAVYEWRMTVFDEAMGNCQARLQIA